MVILGVVLVLIVFCALAWFLPTWLHLAGSSVWILRGSLWFIGLAAAGLFLWWYFRTFRRSQAETEADAGTDEMDPLIEAAIQRVRQATQGASLPQQPQLYIIGPENTAKSTTVVNSGLEPELLAGQVYQDSNIAPTRPLNIWYTRLAVLVEAGGSLMDQPKRWLRLVRKLQPGKLTSAMRKGDQAPRAVVVCLDCEAFVKPGASEAIPAIARNLNARLQELSQQLGISLPVYVLFTKMDRVSFFAEYARNLQRDESLQVLGSTLPMRPPQTGVYAEEETKRMTRSFDELFYALSAKRLDLLARELDQQNLSGIYEFPREWRKLRTLLVQFLVDLGRPSQLQANPFVRGFYFSGVRAVMVEDSVTPTAAVQESAPETAGGATRMLSMDQIRGAMAAAAAPQQRVPTQKKVPQWVFLTQLFNEVITKDRAAMGASGFSSKVSFTRRLLLALAIGVLLFVVLGFTVSFFGNHSLQSDAMAAARQLQTVQTAPGQLPSSDDLRKLDNLRQVLDTLETYKRDGAPFRLRWGLYSGDAIYPEAKRVYFSHFMRMMFGDTRQYMIAQLVKLPPAPNPTDDYGVTYTTLKSYLITTSNHEKSTKAFLTPALMDRWLAGRELDADRLNLARTQWDYYATSLAAENPYSSDNDGALVDRTRIYLSKFAAVERIYRSMLDDADHKNPNVFFNRMFPGSSDAVIDPKEVEGAYTKNGFAFMQDAIAHSDKYFAGEEWVLGKQNYGTFDRGGLEQQLRTRYHDDFLAQWRNFLRAGNVLHYSNAADASKKLNLLSSNNSPLLALFALVSTNTAVSDSDLAGSFQPTQAVVPPNANPYVGPGNQPYMGGLTALLTAVDQLAKSPAGMNDPNAVNQVRNSAMSALAAAKQVEQGFKVDQAGHVDSTSAALLEAPIRAIDGILKPPGLDGGAVKNLCAQFAQITNKFPFNPQSKTQASFAEVNQLFQPMSGAMWVFYDQQLKALVQRQGSEYVVNPASGAKISPNFLHFFSRAAQFSETVYPSGSQSPQLRFTLKGYPVQGINEVTFDMNGQNLTASSGARQFVWTGGELGNVKVTGSMGGADLGILNYNGTWSVFQFFAEADQWQNNGSTQTVEWVPKSGTSGQPMMVAGKPLTLRYDLEMAGAPVFTKGFLGSIRCSQN